MINFSKLLQLITCSLFIGLSSSSFAVCPITGSTDVCENEITAYSTPFTAGESYTWNATGGGTVIGTGNSINVAWTSPGTGSVTLIVKNALNVVICTEVLSVTIHSKPLPVITPSLISGCRAEKGQGRDETSCIAACDSTSMSYTTPYHAGSTYQWILTGSADTSSSSNTFNVYWKGIGSGSIKVIETNSWGCSSATEICVEIVGKPNAAFSTSPGLTGFVVNACLNQSILFTDLSNPGSGSPISSWTWHFGDGSSSYYTAPGSGSTSHAYGSSGTYTAMLIVENECKCKDTAFVTVVVSDEEGPQIFCISTVCPNTTVTYSSNAYGCSSYDWSVSNGVILGSSTDSVVTVQWGSTGPGTITLEVDCGGFCDAPTTVLVPIISSTATINGPSNVCLGDCYTYSISCDIPIDSIVWHFPPGVYVNTDSINVHEVQVCFYSSTSGNITADYYHSTPGARPELSCGGAASLAVSVKPKMVINGASTICDNKTFAFIVTPASTGTLFWTVTDISNTTTFTSNSIVGNTAFGGTWTYGPGQFIITANDVSGNYCNGPVTRYLTVNPTPEPVDSVYGPNPICPNNSYEYTALLTSSTIMWDGKL
ncbi:MAG: PKD domain-containing protein [Bacteroidia bacterium]